MVGDGANKGRKNLKGSNVYRNNKKDKLYDPKEVEQT